MALRGAHPINTEDRERSSSVVRVEGATTTNPESELILMQHSYNQMTADIHLLPEAPPDMVPEIILYEASKKKDYSNNVGPQRKMSLSVRNRTGSGKEDGSRARFGSKDEETAGCGEEQPMLIPGISTTTDHAVTGDSSSSNGSPLAKPGDIHPNKHLSHPQQKKEMP